MLTVKGGTSMIDRMTRRSTRLDQAVLRATVATWLERYASPNTRAAYRADLEHFAQWCGAERVNPFALSETELRRYRAACEANGAGPATVGRRLSAIASFGAFAHEQGDGLAAPHIDRPALPAASTTDALSGDDAVAILAAAEQMNSRAALVIGLLMLDGLKVGEAVGADATDVSGRPPRMTLTLQKEPPRAISLHPDTAELLDAYLGKRRRGPLLFSEHRARATQRLTRYGVDYVVKQAAEAAGVAGPVSGNTLRRHFIVAAHENGEALDRIRHNVGHADARTTRRYLRTPSNDTRP